MVKVKNKLSLEFLVLCDYAIISRENKLSILGIFDQIFVNITPSEHPKMFVVGILKGEPNFSHTLSLTLTDPVGKEILANQNLQVSFGENSNSNFLVELNNLPLSLVGKYTLELFNVGKSLGNISFNVSHSPNSSIKSKKAYIN